MLPASAPLDTYDAFTTHAPQLHPVATSHAPPRSLCVSGGADNLLKVWAPREASAPKREAPAPSSWRRATAVLAERLLGSTAPTCPAVLRHEAG